MKDFNQYSLEGATEKQREWLAVKLKNSQIINPSVIALEHNYGRQKWMACCTRKLHQISYQILLSKLGYTN